MKSALIIGCGYVGGYLHTLLRAEGCDVWSARRTKSLAAQSLAVDVSVPYSLPRDFDVVFYMVSAGAYTAEAYQRAYVTGIQHTIQALQEIHSNARFIFVSSTSVFSENDGAWIDEQSPTDSTTFAKKALLQGETIVAASGLNYAIVRLAGIYGPGRNHLVQLIRSGEARLKRMPFVSNRIHVEDCAGVLYHLAKIDKADSLYIGTDCAPTLYNEVLQWTAQKLGVDGIKYEMQEGKSIHMSNKRCSNAKMLRSGYTFRYPSFREGFLTCV